MSLIRSFCCSAPLVEYQSGGAPIFWVCRLCENECTAEGKQSEGWRKVGNNPSYDMDRAFNIIKGLHSFYSDLSGRRVTTRYLLMAQRAAFVMGATWRERTTGMCVDGKMKEHQAERMYPFPTFDEPPSGDHGGR